MAVTTTTTKNIRLTMGLGNGGNRKIDIENPTTDTSTINATINKINYGLNLSESLNGYKGVLASEDYFNGDTDAKVTAITAAEIIEVQKTTTTTSVFSG